MKENVTHEKTATREIITPPSLRDGDKIAICSPSGAVNNSLFAPGIEYLRANGFEPVLMPHCIGRHGSYSGTPEERLSDIVEAIENPEYKAVLCARGGFGAVQILEGIEKFISRSQPKWIIGYSDISAIHALLQSKGIASIHASMIKSLASANGANEDSQTECQKLFEILRGNPSTDVFPSHPFNRIGNAAGRMVGGNLAVLSELSATPYNIFAPGTILFIEDIGEATYRIERMLWQLRLSGVLHKLSGLIVGQFTGDKPDANYLSAYDMVRKLTADCEYPIAFNAPIGHSGLNIPVVEGWNYEIRVGETDTILTPRDA